MRRKRSPWLWITGVVAVTGLCATVGAFYVLRNRADLLGPGCVASAGYYRGALDIDQAANAATVAGVALRRGLPQRALIVAYATALQESKLQNLPYGDRDSIGIFQQRPSQGWGTPAELHDPVIASERFFAALVKVRNYLRIPIEEAAQRVQRSADGTAYADHIPDAEALANAFGGPTAAAVTCWYKPDSATAAQVAGATSALRRTFGSLTVQDGGVQVSARTGWPVAAWAVAHAQEYGLRTVSYAGYRWTAASGAVGWRQASGDPLPQPQMVNLG